MKNIILLFVLILLLSNYLTAQPDFILNSNFKYAYWGLADPSKLPEDVVIKNDKKNNFVAYAKKGKPVIDAVENEIWDIAEHMNINIYMEVRIPFRFVEPAAGVKFGFDLQINYDSGTRSRSSYSKWNDPTNESYRNTSGFGTLILGE